MRQNPMPKKARKLLDGAHIPYKYLEYGSYFSKWKERLAIKLWSGWPTFPQVYVKGEFLGGSDILIEMYNSGELREKLETATGARIGVMIIDSHGRAWRLGTIGTAIGISGLPGLVDKRGWKDLFGYTLQITVVGIADELAAAASLVMGQAAEGTPVVHVRGFPYPLRDGSIKELLRPKEQDMFR